MELLKGVCGGEVDIRKNRAWLGVSLGSSNDSICREK